MKDNNKMAHGGKLKPENYAIWAKYMARYVTEFKKEGVPIFMLTVENEPHHAQSWESCVYSGTEEGNYAVKNLKPALKEAGHEEVKVFIWDQSKGGCLSRATEAYGVEGGMENIDGLAFHWYWGDNFDDIAKTHDKFPDKPMICTEICRELTDGLAV
jgi:glucosylceramidase